MPVRTAKTLTKLYRIPQKDPGARGAEKSLIHEPEIVDLDKPAIGLDLIAKERIRAFIQPQNRAHQTTVVLTQNWWKIALNASKSPFCARRQPHSHGFTP